MAVSPLPRPRAAIVWPVDTQIRWYLYRLKYVSGTRTLEEEHIEVKSGESTPTFQAASACQSKRRSVDPTGKPATMHPSFVSNVSSASAATAAHATVVEEWADAMVTALREEEPTRAVPLSDDARWQGRQVRAAPTRAPLETMGPPPSPPSPTATRGTVVQTMGPSPPLTATPETVPLETRGTLAPTSPANTCSRETSCRSCVATGICKWCSSLNPSCIMATSKACLSPANTWDPRRLSDGAECPAQGKTGAAAVTTTLTGADGDVNAMYALHVVAEDGAHATQPNHLVARRLILYMPTSTFEKTGSISLGQVSSCC